MRYNSNKALFNFALYSFLKAGRGSPCKFTQRKERDMDLSGLFLNICSTSSCRVSISWETIVMCDVVKFIWYLVKIRWSRIYYQLSELSRIPNFSHNHPLAPSQLNAFGSCNYYIREKMNNIVFSFSLTLAILAIADASRRRTAVTRIPRILKVGSSQLIIYELENYTRQYYSYTQLL